jgi:hypothetical protein
MSRLAIFILVLLWPLIIGGKKRKKSDEKSESEWLDNERAEVLAAEEKVKNLVAVNASSSSNSSSRSPGVKSPNSNTTTASQTGGYFDFIFGWSTGHVGTTTLSEKKLYGAPENVTFMHEMKYGKEGLPGLDDVYTTDKWLQGNYSDEYRYVKTRYIPWLLKNKYDRSRTLVDLGHNINYFYNALVDYLLNETSYRFIFVRIRRERTETAQSLIYGHPDQAFADVCAELKVRFCPFDKADSNVLRLPGPNPYLLWEGFSNVQKALWIADETEARWQQLRQRYKGRFEYLEILWAKKWDGSIDFAALQIARLVGIYKVQKWDPTWPHMEMHVHAGDESIDPVALWNVYREDKLYQEAMGFFYTPA